MVTVEKRMVQFTQNCSPYSSGERASFNLVEAGKLVGRGIAFYVKRDDHGDWVPDNGENDDNVKQADQDGSADGEGEAGTDGEGKTQPTRRTAASKPTARSGQQRRPRAKL